MPDRADWGMKMVHEALRTPYTGGSALIRSDRAVAPQLERIVANFGYTNADTVGHNYWDEQPVLRVNNSAVKWIALARPQAKALMLVLQSWATNDIQVKLTIERNTLGFSPALNARNAETGATFDYDGHNLDLKLPGPYGVRLLEFR